MTILEQYLTSLGWEHEKTDIDVRWTDPKGEWQVSVSEHGKWWELGKFTDADVYVPDFGYQAQGRFESVDTGETLEELKTALALAQAIASYSSRIGRPPVSKLKSEAHQIVSSVCREYRNSDLRADNKDIIAAFDSRIEELKKSARKYDRLLTMLAEKAWEEENRKEQP